MVLAFVVGFGLLAAALCAKPINAFLRARQDTAFRNKRRRSRNRQDQSAAAAKRAYESV